MLWNYPFRSRRGKTPRVLSAQYQASLDAVLAGCTPQPPARVISSPTNESKAQQLAPARCNAVAGERIAFAFCEGMFTMCFSRQCARIVTSCATFASAQGLQRARASDRPLIAVNANAGCAASRGMMATRTSPRRSQNGGAGSASRPSSRLAAGLCLPLSHAHIWGGVRTNYDWSVYSRKPNASVV